MFRILANLPNRCHIIQVADHIVTTLLIESKGTWSLDYANSTIYVRFSFECVMD